MAENSYSYSVPVKTQEGETPLTAEQREQLRSPGKAILDGSGFRIEQPQQANIAPAAEDRSEWWNFATLDNKRVDIFAPGLDESKVMIPIGSDVMTLTAARNANLIKKDGSGRWLPIGGTSSPAAAQQSTEKKSDEQPKPQDAPSQSSPAEDTVPMIGADEMLGGIAEKIGDAQIYGFLRRGCARRADQRQQGRIHRTSARWWFGD